MVSVIHFGTSVRRVLNYNEQKVSEGVAECIEAGYYLQDPDRLTFNQKLHRLQNQIALAPNIKYNTVHISLNFHPSEKHNNDILKAIAATYLDKIGFAGQPYLLYQHFDAGHPHVHILTTTVKPDGHGINLHNLGKIHSEKARREIEIDFGLVRADDKINRTMNDLKPINTKVHYGKAATKRAMLNVLNIVFQEYKFCSLPELNVVLNLYNLAAERGTKDSRVFKNGGLVYRVRNADGSYQGVPIKASDFLIRSTIRKGEQVIKPTLKNAENYFAVNRKARIPFKNRLKNAIDLTLLKDQYIGLKGLANELMIQGIDTVFRYTKDGKVFGVTFVDHQNSCVFNGNTLGKEYSAAALLRRSGETTGIRKDLNHIGFRLEKRQENSFSAHTTFTPAPFNPHTEESPESLLQVLFQAERDHNYLPYELSGKKKIKKKQKGYRL